MKIEGNAILLHVDGEVIGCTTEATLSITPYDFPPVASEKPVVTGCETWELMVDGVKNVTHPKLTIRPNDFPRKVKKRLKAFFHCRTNFFHYKGITLRG